MPGRICKHEGCDRLAKGRGMCGPHYMKWRRANPGITMMKDNEKAVLESMPGTLGELIERSGLLWRAVRRALAVLRADDKARIGGWRPPVESAEKWKPIYMAGPGKDVELEEERKRQNARNLRNARLARQAGRPYVPRKRKAGAFSPLFGASL